jgi:hypothetical protein
VKGGREVKELPSVLQEVIAERSEMSITQFFRNRFPILFGRPRIQKAAAGIITPASAAPKAPASRILCIGRIHRGRMTMITAFPRQGTEGDGKQIRKDQGGQDHVTVSQGREEERKA